MNEVERDALLIRLDERSINTWKSIEKIETHQKDQNGYIEDCLKSTIKNTAWRKAYTWLIGSGIIALILKLIGVY